MIPKGEAMRALFQRFHRLGRSHRDDGMNTAEYAVGTLAAVAFAGPAAQGAHLGPVRDALAGIIGRALQ